MRRRLGDWRRGRRGQSAAAAATDEQLGAGPGLKLGDPSATGKELRGPAQGDGGVRESSFAARVTGEARRSEGRMKTGQKRLVAEVAPGTGKGRERENAEERIGRGKGEGGRKRRVKVDERWPRSERRRRRAETVGEKKKKEPRRRPTCEAFNRTPAGPQGTRSDLLSRAAAPAINRQLLPHQPSRHVTSRTAAGKCSLTTWEVPRGQPTMRGLGTSALQADCTGRSRIVGPVLDVVAGRPSRRPPCPRPHGVAVQMASQDARGVRSSPSCASSIPSTATAPNLVWHALAAATANPLAHQSSSPLPLRPAVSGRGVMSSFAKIIWSRICHATSQGVVAPWRPS